MLCFENNPLALQSVLISTKYPANSCELTLLYDTAGVLTTVGMYPRLWPYPYPSPSSPRLSTFF